MNAYYALRFKIDPHTIRFQRSASPSTAFRQIFGGEPSDTAEWKLLRPEMFQHRHLKLDVLNDPNGWITFANSD
jgi:hypothetical protein